MAWGEYEPWITLKNVESCVLLTTLLIAFLTVFGSWRRRSHSLMLKYSIWASYLLSTYLVNYTMGLMKSSEFRYELFAVWATFLITFLGSADCISAFNLEDIENRRRFNWELFVQYFWLCWLIGVHTYNDPKHMIPLYLICLLSMRRTGGRAEALELASKSYGLVRNTKLVADFMEDESKKEDDDADPACMKGYKYLVKGEKKTKVKVRAPHYHMLLETTDDPKVITIDMIWQCKGRLLSSTGDPDGRLKDICLSYSLYRLLCRRFAKYSFTESSQLKTWNFVRYGLLSRGGDDYERAFRVIEVELGFLYDLFYTKYPVLFSKGFPLSKNFEVIIVISGCWIVAAAILINPASVEIFNFMNSGRRDALLTVVVLVAMLFMEVVQFFHVIFSDWAKVQWLCYYVEKPLWQNNKCIEMIIRVLCHRELLKPWNRKLAQYSLLESFSHNPSVLLYNRWTSPYIDKPRNGLKRSAHVTLPMEVKKAIIHSLKTNEQRLTNGVASLQRNGVENELSWACRLETQTHVIMVWHIATSLCELNLLSQEIVTGEQVNQQRESEDFIVATKLSKYCAYLVAFAPRLLPDHPYITEFIFDHVVVEARKKLKGCEKSICQKLFTLRKDDRKKRISKKMLTLDQEDDKGIEEIIEKGAVLAKDLLEKIEDNGLRWKILAELWAEMMLFVAPSDDATAHAEHLAMGGEFVTHLWALLSHAGILKRDSAQDV